MSGVQYLTTQDIISNDIHFDYPVPQEHGTFELECPNVATGVTMSCQVAAITYPETVDFGSLSEMTLDVYGALNATASTSLPIPGPCWQRSPITACAPG